MRNLLKRRGPGEVKPPFPLARIRPRGYRCGITTVLPRSTLAVPWILVLAVLPSQGAEPPDPVSGAAPAPESLWLLTVLNLAAVVCFALWWRWLSRRAPAPSTSMALAVFDPDAEAEWKTRALAAEARADKAAALLKARLMPQLARWMMTELVQKLLHQRSGLAASQQKAEAEVAELERRLEQLQAPLAERLRAYEQRIAELERQLSLQGEQNRELLRATIATARKKLEAERARSPLNWN